MLKEFNLHSRLHVELHVSSSMVSQQKMAAGGTAQVLGKISAGHLECSICFNRFREPKVLDCLHTFCLKCLQELIQCKDLSKQMIACPLCRRDTLFKEVADLSNNFTMSALVEEFTLQEQLLEGQGSEIKCQACDDAHAAISRCMDCDHYLCQECQKAHGRMSVMKSHKIYTLAQLQSGEITYKSKLREYVPKCGKHPDQSFSIYCNTCEQLVCTTCFILDHEKHSRIGLPEALDKCKKDVAELAAKAKKNKTEISQSMSEIDKTHRKLDTMYADTSNKISKKADKEVTRIRKEIDKIRKEEEILKQEAEKVYQDRIKTLETAQATNNINVTQTEHKLDEVNQLMTQASCCEILDLKQKLMHNLNELTKNQLEKVPERTSFMDFEEGDEGSLGRLMLEVELQAEVAVRPRRWELKMEIKTFEPQQTTFQRVHKVAAFSNNEIVVLDDAYEEVIIILSKSELQSTVLPQELHLTGLSHPSHVSVNKDDQLIILDPPAVKIFNRGNQSCLHQFIPDRTYSKPTCLAVDDNNLIAVGYKGIKISLHNPDGTLIKTLHAKLTETHLTIWRQRLIYTNLHTQKLASIDHSGNMLFTVDIPSMIIGGRGTHGLCCDSQGGIYIGVSGLRSQGEIHHFSPDGKYIGCVIKGCGSPHDITFTPDGELAIAARESVKIYHRV